MAEGISSWGNITEETIKQILLDKKYLSPEDGDKVQKLADQHRESFLATLVEQKILDEKVISQAIAEYYGVSFADLKTHEPSQETVLKIPESVARQYTLVIFHQEIQGFTGISPHQLESAPAFRQIAAEVIDLLKDCMFVAHNVRFDYGFIKNEFKRIGVDFQTKQCCTVRLSRALYPEMGRHSLDHLINYFGFTCENRHRALDDAQILWEFLQVVQKDFPAADLDGVFKMVSKRPSLPLKISHDDLDALPEAPGVYIFYGEDRMPLYIGKSINIKDRVMSHFSSDHSSTTEMKIAQQIESIETIPTAGELGALFKEASLIKKMQPLYNRQLRRAQKLVALKFNKDNEYETVDLETIDIITPDEINSIAGIFRSKRQAKDFLSTVAKENNLCEKLLGLENLSGSCFAYHLGKCSGACVQKELPIKYNMRFVSAFLKTRIKPWPFKKPIIIEEQNEINEKAEAHIVDRWCYLGTLSEADDISSLENNLIFDLDTYRILERFLRSQKNVNRIKTFDITLPNRSLGYT